MGAGKEKALESFPGNITTFQESVYVLWRWIKENKEILVICVILDEALVVLNNIYNLKHVNSKRNGKTLLS
jgi:hypothetical protein